MGAATRDANLTTALDLAERCYDAYGQASDGVRRQMNQAFFERILVTDERDVTGELQEPFRALLSPALRRQDDSEPSLVHANPGAEGLQDQKQKDKEKPWSGHIPGQGLNKAFLVALTEVLSRHSHGLARLKTDTASPPATRPRPLQAHRRQAQRILRPDEIRDLVDAYVRGATVYELAARYKIHRATVSAKLRSSGVRLRLDRLSKAQVEEAVNLYQSGLSLVKVGKRIGASPGTVQSRLRERGVSLRDTHGRARN